MPEGDTIFRTAAVLRSALEGKLVLGAQPEGLKRLTGRTVSAIEPVGKHLVIRHDKFQRQHIGGR